MFIETSRFRLRTPAGCYVRRPGVTRRLIRHIAPRWGAASYTPRFYKHCTPLGAIPPTHLRHLFCAADSEVWNQRQ